MVEKKEDFSRNICTAFPFSFDLIGAKQGLALLVLGWGGDMVAQWAVLVTHDKKVTVPGSTLDWSFLHNPKTSLVPNSTQTWNINQNLTWTQSYSWNINPNPTQNPQFFGTHRARVG